MTRKKRLRRDKRYALKTRGRLSSNSPALSAAHDYRAQQQARVGKEPHRESIESMVARGLPHLRQFFPDLKSHHLVSEFHKRSLHVDTAWDEPLLHAMLLDSQKKIEAACDQLGYQIRDGISIGFLKLGATEAMQQPVMLTDTSVIMLTNNLQLLMHRTAKLLALSIPYKVSSPDQFNISMDIAEAVALVNSNKQLQRDWAMVFINYATNPEDPFVGDPVIVTEAERHTIWEDVGEAMMLFVVGHEYAHHILKHSLSGMAGAAGVDTETSHRMEREADTLGVMLSMHAGEAEKIPNLFAIFGIGAATVLTVIEYCRHATQVLAHGEVKDEARATHPPLSERLEGIAYVVPEILKPYGPDQTDVVRRMQGMFVGIIQNAWNSAKAALALAHRNGIRPTYSEEVGWLPGRGIAQAGTSDDRIDSTAESHV